MAVSSVTISPSSTLVTYQILNSDGTVHASHSVTHGGLAVLDPPPLPANGTYTLYFDPYYAATSGLTATLSADAGGTLTIDGSSAPVSTSLLGQTVRFTFSGTAGQYLGLGITGLTLTPSSSSPSFLRVYKPDGNQLVANSCYTSSLGGGCEVDIANLPTTGTYNVVLTPPSATTALSTTAALSTDLSGTLTAGTGYNLSVTRNGQNARLTFSGTAAQNKRLDFTTLSTNPSGGSLWVVVYQPNGTQLTQFSITGSGGSQTLNNLPATGNYTVVVSPNFAVTATVTITLVNL